MAEFEKVYISVLQKDGCFERNVKAASVRMFGLSAIL